MTWKTTEEGYEQVAQNKEREAETLERAEGLGPRQGWGDAFKDMAKHGDDKLPDWDPDLQSDFDDTEWEWE